MNTGNLLTDIPDELYELYEQRFPDPRHLGGHGGPRPRPPPGPRYLRADMRDFDLPEVFDAVVCLDSALLYCHHNHDLVAFLERCADHLAPGGS